MSKSIWTGMMWGFLVGSIVSLLLAPQSGKATRDIIAAKSRDARGKASQMASSASQRAQYMREKIKPSI